MYSDGRHRNEQVKLLMQHLREVCRTSGHLVRFLVSEVVFAA